MTDQNPQITLRLDAAQIENADSPLEEAVRIADIYGAALRRIADGTDSFSSAVAREALSRK